VSRDQHLAGSLARAKANLDQRAEGKENRQMREETRFAKQVLIRLAEDGTGFHYTVAYGWLRLPTRHIRLFEEGGKPVEVEMPVTRTREGDHHPAPKRPGD